MPPSCQPVDPLVEGVCRRHVLEYLWVGVFCKACCVRDDLGKLTPGNLVVGAEGAIRVTGDDASACQAADVCVEGMAGRHVCELKWTRRGCVRRYKRRRRRGC